MAQASNVIAFPGTVYRTPPKKKSVRGKSFYDLYPMEFFNKKELCAWCVQPTGRYGEDYATGQRFAQDFLKSCDGTIGWQSLLQVIVVDMVRQGPNDSQRGLVLGFMSVIGGLTVAALARAGAVSANRNSF